MKSILKESLQIGIVICVIIGIGYACKKNRFKKEVFLEEMYTYKAEPEINAAINAIELLQNSWATYGANTTGDNFSTVTSNYVDVANQMEEISFYNLGDVSAVYVFSRFYKTSIDTNGIIDAYNMQESFAENDIANYVNTRKGLYALEYLFYSTSFADSLTEPKFINFIDAHLSYLHSSSTEFQNTWNIYQKNFIKNDGEGVSDSYNIVINRIIHVLEDLINKRIADPLDGNDHKLAVGHYSNKALEKIKIQVLQLQQVYLGIGTETFNSVYNNLRKKNKKLADKVSDKFEEAVTFGNGMSYEMDYYIHTTSAPLIDYKNLLIELLAFFKGDIQDELNIIITFGDTDGD